MASLLVRQADLSNQEVNQAVGDVEIQRPHSRLNTRIHLLYNEMEFLLEFCFVLIVLCSAFIVSITARNILLTTE